MSESSWPRRMRPPFPGAAGPNRPLSPRVLAAAEPLLAVAGIGAWHYAQGGRLWWSEETCRIHGVAPDWQPDLDSAIAFYVPEHRPIIAAAVAAAIRDGEPWDLELCIRRQDGECRVASHNYVTICVSRDVTCSVLVAPPGQLCAARSRWRSAAQS